MKLLKSFTMLLLLLAAVFTFSACGGGDDSGSGDNGGSTLPDNGGGYTQYNATYLQGVWIGYTANYSYALAVGIYDDGSCAFILYHNNGSNFVKDYEDEGTYQFNTNTGELVVRYDNNTQVESFFVKNQTYSSFTLYVRDMVFNMERYVDEEEGGGESTQDGYAPKDVSDYTFKIKHIGQTYRVYFTSNTTINSSYCYIPLPESTVQSAEYTRTGANTARVDINYYNSVLNKYSTYSFDLTFTSETGGTSRCENLDGSFTIEKTQREDNVSAPLNISYRKFTTQSGSYVSNWWQFGEQMSNVASITSYGGTATTGSKYYRHYGVYTRYSSTEATLVIHEQAYEQTSDQATTYSLEFLTSTSGRFTSSHYSSFTGKTTTQSGTFTLE